MDDRAIGREADRHGPLCGRVARTGNCTSGQRGDQRRGNVLTVVDPNEVNCAFSTEGTDTERHQLAHGRDNDVVITTLIVIGCHLCSLNYDITLWENLNILHNLI